MNDAQATATDPSGPKIIDNPYPPPPAYLAFRKLGDVTGLTSQGHGVLGLLSRLDYGFRYRAFAVVRNWFTMERLGVLSIGDSPQPLTLDEAASSFPGGTSETVQVYKGKLAFELQVYRLVGGDLSPRTTESEVTLTISYTASDPSAPTKGELSGDVDPQFLRNVSSFIMTFEPVIDFSSPPQPSQTYGMGGGLLHFY